MRGFGRVLVGVGIAVGIATGVALLMDLDVPGVGSWLVGVAVAKLAFFSALALIAVGTVLQRRAAHERSREDALDGIAGDATGVGGRAEPRALGEGAAPARPLPAAEREPRDAGRS